MILQFSSRRQILRKARAQLSFGDGLIAEEVSDLRENWMKHADVVLADEAIVATVYEALAKRHPKSRCRGRRQRPPLQSVWKSKTSRTTQVAQFCAGK